MRKLSESQAELQGLNCANRPVPESPKYLGIRETQLVLKLLSHFQLENLCCLGLIPRTG